MPEVEIAGATLHYETSGAGEPILLIPGLGLDHTYYRLGAPLLARHMEQPEQAVRIVVDFIAGLRR